MEGYIINADKIFCSEFYFVMMLYIMLHLILLADKILFFEDGRIEQYEYRTHEKLLNRSGKYADFWKMQTSSYQI